MEHKTWWKAITYPERIDYVSFQNNELAFVLAIEKLLEVDVPPKAAWMRMLLCELNRVHSHLIWLATGALELGAISMFWYCFRERERILDLFELCCGTRMHTRYFQAGGLAEDIPRGFFPECRAFTERMPGAVDEYETMLNRNAIWLERTKGLGLLSAADALALGQSGPVLRASGSTGTCARTSRTSPTTRSISASPSTTTATSTTVTGCTWRRCASRRRSSRRRSTGSRTWSATRGSWTTGASCCRRGTSSIPRWKVLIHHFKIVTEGYRVPEGEIYVPTESPRGEFGCYVVSSGGPKPWRVKFRAPSFVALEATATCMSDALVADLIAIVGSLDTVMGEVDR